MAHVLQEEELDLYQPLGQKSSGLVVVQFGKRRLRVEGEISLTPYACFVPLPEDVEITDAAGKKVVPKGSKRFFISIGTIGPHIVIEAWDLPLATAENG